MLSWAQEALAEQRADYAMCEGECQLGGLVWPAGMLRSVEI